MPVSLHNALSKGLIRSPCTLSGQAALEPSCDCRCVLLLLRKEGRKEGRREGRKEEGRKEGGREGGKECQCALGMLR